MTKYIYIVILLSCYISIQAQQIVKDITLPSGNLSEVNGLVVSDSLFLTIKGNSNSNRYFNSFWLNPSGEISNANVDELKDKALCTLYNFGDSTFFLYVDVVQNIAFLKTLVQHRTTGAKSISPKKIKLEGRLLSVFFDRDLFLISVLAKENRILVTQLNNLNIAKETTINLPYDFLPNENFGFIYERYRSFTNRS